MELYAFGDEMLNEESFGFPSRSPLKQRHVLFSFILGQIWSAGTFLGIAAIAFVLHLSGLISEVWAIGISGTCVSLFLLFLLTSVCGLPLAWAAQRKGRGHVRLMLAEMQGVYNATWSDGPISAVHIRQKIEAAAKNGVVWPAPLYVMTDDVLARSGRF